MPDFCLPLPFVGSTHLSSQTLKYLLQHFHGLVLLTYSMDREIMAQLICKSAFFCPRDLKLNASQPKPPYSVVHKHSMTSQP